MATERIEVPQIILLDLHNGASAESVQELFNEHFTDCLLLRSAWWSMSWWTEYRWPSRCHVPLQCPCQPLRCHSECKRWLIPTIPGHPVADLQAGKSSAAGCPYAGSRYLPKALKMRTFFLKSARIQRQLSWWGSLISLSAQRKICSYTWKLQPRFAIRSWGVDDQVETFPRGSWCCQSSCLISIQVRKSLRLLLGFEACFQGRSILLMILRGRFHQDDGSKIAEEKESDAYG